MAAFVILDVVLGVLAAASIIGGIVLIAVRHRALPWFTARYRATFSTDGAARPGPTAALIAVVGLCWLACGLIIAVIFAVNLVFAADFRVAPGRVFILTGPAIAVLCIGLMVRDAAFDQEAEVASRMLYGRTDPATTHRRALPGAVVLLVISIAMIVLGVLAWL